LHPAEQSRGEAVIDEDVRGEDVLHVIYRGADALVRARPLVLPIGRALALIVSSITMPRFSTRRR
jgi:hypothetical protein